MHALRTSQRILIPVFIFLIVFMVSCGNKRGDTEIQQEVNGRLASSREGNANLSNVTAQVKEGKVTLTGTCEGTGCADSAMLRVQEIKGVENITNEVTEAPQQTDLTLRTAVQSVISKYAGVQADVAAGEVILRGTIQRDQLQPLMNELSALQAKKIDNQLAITQ